IGVRTKDANGVWSFDNIWLFAKAASAKPAPALKYVEYYIDSAKAYGAGTPVAIDPVTNLPDYSIPVNISGLSAGKHGVYFRSRDANGAWTLDDSMQFNITSTAAVPYIVVNSVAKKTVCAANNVDVSFDAKGNFAAGNIFTVQMSNISGSFANPVVIGSVNSRNSATVSCTIPSNTTPGKGYRVRVISSNVPVTGAIGLDTLTIGAVLATPTITANGPLIFCAGGNVKLTSSNAVSYLWNNGDTTKTITAANSGNYRVTITNNIFCTATSLPTVVTVNAIPVATISASGSTTNVCPGTTVTLTASQNNSYLWSNGATTQSIAVTNTGSYSVIVTNASGCKDTSDAVAVTFASCPAPKGLKATVTSATTATLKWKQANCGVGYQVQLRLSGSTAWSAPVSVAALSYKPTGLLSDTSYEWQVATICQASPLIISAYSPGAVFTTPVSFDAAITLINSKTTGIFNAAIMPNPTNGSTALTVNGAPSGYSVSIGDIAGKILWKSLNVKDRRFQLPVERFASGVYLVSISDGVNTKVLKLVKQ
ncbi:MAG: T9SS type A sorting domain-containing protein, partial [Panacibacter sp.]